MICDGCGIDRTVTVLYAWTLTRFIGPSAREVTERRERRLCGPCGGAMTTDEQREMPLDNPNRRRHP